ncbi:hypothetical protein PPTG_04047 [Phytophthora nicotianae INRA-310]|uniref:HTH psq-type domain-containing protein n=4 Tax=Phytophthora nicotianae TaxID=4792 RepID=W2QZN8_PHYN3|nr:hypothetical protein PPTG_04047 [Phytophthora nicotianae INRA-310]ETN18446.1 hypothetical protein PPTG_04047 [Phytophthora nicotianae INRA-310]KUF98186.1 hypothetical protein AM587_10011070 [Phytophthora nicotianae]
MSKPTTDRTAQQISPSTEQAMSNTRRDWSPGSVSDGVWAQAVHAVVERRLSMRQASQTFGLQQVALQRLVRQHTLQRHGARGTPPMQSLPGSTTSPTSDDRRFAVAVSSSASANERYVFPRLNPLALGQRSPTGAPLPSVAPVPTVMSPPPVCELTPEINNEIVSVLREQFIQQQQYDDYETSDGRLHRLEGYADADIAEVARAIVGLNGRRALPTNFPSVGWLTLFKRENDFVDMDDIIRGRSRTRTGSSNSLKGILTPQQLQQERYSRSYEIEQQYELERRGDQLRWAQNRSYRQPAAPPPTQLSPEQPRSSYSWEDVDVVDGAGSSMPQQRLRFYQPPRQSREDSKYRGSLSPGSSTGRSVHSDSNSSDRNYRQSNLVPAKVWEAAMEDVAIHGMSLRNAAKAHGVHFAALHRRLKKRQQHKLNTPCDPNYIPFEDEAGVVRVIHARADMGVLLTFTELVELLKRTALKHRSELPEDIATALVRRFQSRVEQSVRHLIIDWPAQPNNVLYRLRDTSNSEDGDDGMDSGVAAPNADKSAPSIISGSSGEGGSQSSSGSSSPHEQSVASFSMMHKAPVDAALAQDNSKNNNSDPSEDSSNTTSTDSGGDTSSATVSPGDNEMASSVSPGDNETASSQPCMIFRL